MKKLFGIALIIVLSTSVLAGCGKKSSTGTPAATDMPAAAANENPTPADADTETNTEVVTSAIDLTAYPVMWCQEDPLYPQLYDSRFKTTLASEIYEEDDIIGTVFVGFRLIDDTHIEEFSHYKLNDDIDASLLLSSVDDETFTQREMIRINDREADKTQQTWNYEIDGTNIFISDEHNTFNTFNVSPDFTSFFRGQSEYTYHADF